MKVGSASRIELLAKVLSCDDLIAKCAVFGEARFNRVVGVWIEMVGRKVSINNHPDILMGSRLRIVAVYDLQSEKRQKAESYEVACSHEYFLTPSPSVCRSNNT